MVTSALTPCGRLGPAYAPGGGHGSDETAEAEGRDAVEEDLEHERADLGHPARDPPRRRESAARSANPTAQASPAPTPRSAASSHRVVG